jgi:hypothetical protein
MTRSSTPHAEGVITGVMRQLSSKPWIVVKGLLFLVIAASSVGLVFLEAPSLRVGVLLALTVWASCRFYYFLFYVLERYVDRSLRYAGLLSLLGRIWEQTRNS